MSSHGVIEVKGTCALQRNGKLARCFMKTFFDNQTCSFGSPHLMETLRNFCISLGRGILLYFTAMPICSFDMDMLIGDAHKRSHSDILK